MLAARGVSVETVLAEIYDLRRQNEKLQLELKHEKGRVVTSLRDTELYERLLEKKTEESKALEKKAAKEAAAAQGWGSWMLGYAPTPVASPTVAARVDDLPNFDGSANLHGGVAGRKAKLPELRFLNKGVYEQDRMG